MPSSAQSQLEFKYFPSPLFASSDVASGLELLKLFAEGGLPATTVQSIAAAFADGWGQGEELAERLKQADGRGKHRSNCLRDVLRLSKTLGVGNITPEPYHVEVPSANGGSRRVAVCLPYEQYQMLVHTHGLGAWRLSPEAFAASEGLGTLVQDWGSKPEISLDARDVALLGLHADGVSYSASARAGHAKGVLAASWNVVSAPEQAHRGRRFVFLPSARHFVATVVARVGILSTLCSKSGLGAWAACTLEMRRLADTMASRGRARMRKCGCKVLFWRELRS